MLITDELCVREKDVKGWFWLYFIKKITNKTLKQIPNRSFITFYRKKKMVKKSLIVQA